MSENPLPAPRRPTLGPRLPVRILLVACALLLAAASGARAGTAIRLGLALAEPAGKDRQAIAGTPAALAVHPAGTVIVVTAEGDIHRVLDTGGGSKSAKLEKAGAVAVAISSDERIYIAMKDGTLYEYNSALSKLASGSVPATPVDLTVDPDGLVYVAASDGQVFKRTAALAPIASPKKVAGTPTAIEASAGGEIYVSTKEGTVYRLTPTLAEGASGSVAGTPVDVATNDSGFVVVASADGKLHSVSSEIVELKSITLSGALVGVAIDSAGNVAAATGSGSVFVTKLTSAGFGPSKSLDAKLSPMVAVGMNLAGDIYVTGGPAGATPPDIKVSSASLEFARTAIGSASLPTASFDVTHVAGGTLTLTTTSSKPAAFEVLSSPATLAPGGTGKVEVRFKAPSPAGTYEETIKVEASAGGLSDAETVKVKGESFVCKPIDPASLHFDKVNRGTRKALTFRVENCGAKPLQLLSLAVETADPAGVWSVSPAVPPAVAVPVGGKQVFTVTFAVPAELAADAPFSATFKVTTDDAASATRTVTADGFGHVPMAKIAIDSFLLDFKEVQLGFHHSLPFVVHNRGDLALTFKVSYSDPADADRKEFALETDAESFTLDPGKERIFRQTFQPASVGDKEIVLLVHDTNDRTFTSRGVTLRGTGTTPVPIDAVLVLDRSGSMAEKAGELVKIDALRIAAGLFADLLRDGTDLLGAVRYNKTSETVVSLGPIETVRDPARAAFAALAPAGTTGIGGAMRTAADQYALSPPVTPPAPAHKQVMVVLTDGKENEDPRIREVLDGSGGRPGLFVEHPELLAYSVGLGTASNINADRLQEITNRGPGGFFLVTGNLEGLDLFNLESFYFKIFADSIGHDLVADPTVTLAAGEVLDAPVGVVTADREALFFLESELNPGNFDVWLVDPQGREFFSSGTAGGALVTFRQRDRWAYFRVAFPPPQVSREYVGTWHLRAEINVVKSGGGKAEAPRFRFTYQASVGSDYKLTTQVGPGVVLAGEPIQLAATLTDGGWPSPDATVAVGVERPDGGAATVALQDDGLHGDGAAGDGVFGGAYLDTSPADVYRFLFHSQGRTERGEAVERMEVKSQFVGAPSAEPPPPFSDCNHNGLPDEQDIARGTSADANADGVPDECQIAVVPWSFRGTAQGGQVSATLAGPSTTCTVAVATAPGQPAAAVAAALAAAVNADPCAAGQGITASADGGTVRFRGFFLRFLGGTVTDPGLAQEIPIVAIPTLASPGLLVLAGLLAASGLLLAARRRRQG